MFGRVVPDYGELVTVSEPLQVFGDDLLNAVQPGLVIRLDMNVEFVGTRGDRAAAPRAERQCDLFAASVDVEVRPAACGCVIAGPVPVAAVVVGHRSRVLTKLFQVALRPVGRNRGFARGHRVPSVLSFGLTWVRVSVRA